MWAILCDYDGTIMKNDVAEGILRRFAKPGWRIFSDRLVAGEITVEECVSEEYAMIEASSVEEILGYASRLYRLRPGFKTLLRDCGTYNVVFAVVSAGIDFCIRDSFRTEGIEMPQLVCPTSTLIPMGGLKLVFPKRRSNKSRDFKEDAVMTFRARGHRVAYVGDGSGDVNAAERSDIVFAVKGSMLQRACVERGIAHRAIQTFEPVSTFISRTRAE